MGRCALLANAGFEKLEGQLGVWQRIDLGKTTFHLVALGAAGKVLVKKKFTQKQLLAY